MYPAKVISDWFLAWALEETGSTFKKTKLHKMLYYAEGHHLAEFGDKLMDDAVEAWEYGPAVNSVFERYKNTAPDEDLPAPDPASFSWDSVTPEDTELLIKVWNTYGGLSSSSLVLLTHTEKLWLESYVPGVQRIVIDEIEMKSFFSTEKMAA